jgi:hypothetical protein
MATQANMKDAFLSDFYHLVLGFWGFGVLGFWGFGVLGFYDFLSFAFPAVWQLNQLSFPSSEHAYVRY